MKTYKLNKTFENSMYPIEKELEELKNSTQKSITGLACSIASAFFSGAGTSLLFNTEALPQLISEIQASNQNTSNIPSVFWNILVTLGIFVILFIVGLLLSHITIHTAIHKKYRKYQNQKKTHDGRKELQERFHKSIINNISIGISFVDKAEDNDFQSSVEQMYLFEAAYYFQLAKDEFDTINIIDLSGDAISRKLLEHIGTSTVLSTLTVYADSLSKLLDHMADSVEKQSMKALYEDVKNNKDYLERPSKQNK